jgi:hypothetical protein
VVQVRVGEQQRIQLGRLEGERDRLRLTSSGEPWNMPQSTSTVAPPVRTRNCEPVTVPTAPRN